MTPRITFGIIVLNGEPFTRYTLRMLYPFAHEIIVVEGAVPAAAENATPDGHSRDGTLDVLRRFKVEEDPDDKLQIVTCEGFWEEKDAMSRAYAERATGDYLWQVDVDEFYKAEDIQAVIDMLRDDSTITAMSFKMLTFWGAPDYIVDGWYLRRGANIYHRLFKWSRGYRYVTHRPPTVYDDQDRDLRDLHWVGGEALARRGILMYHYSLLFPHQVQDKSTYYGRADWANRREALYFTKDNYLELKHPFQVHNVPGWPSWLARYDGNHPAALQALWHDIQAERLNVDLRPVADIEKLLNSPMYRLGRLYYQWVDYPHRAYHDLQRRLVPLKRLLR